MVYISFEYSLQGGKRFQRSFRSSVCVLVMWGSQGRRVTGVISRLPVVVDH